ncbi:MAG: hypothetical protein AAFZ07_16490 [Actinomycetota bacterium]
MTAPVDETEPPLPLRFITAVAIAGVAFFLGLGLGLVLSADGEFADEPAPTTSPTVTTTVPTTVPVTDRPDITNTGHDDTSLLIVESSLIRVTEPGTVIENVRALDGIRVEATDVTIRNSYVTSARTNVIDCSHADCRGLVVEDVTIEGARPCQQGIGYRSFTARRVDVSGCVDGFKGHSDTTVEASWCHDLDKYDTANGGSTHNDCFQGTGGSDVTIRGNSFEAIPLRQTSAIKISGQRAPLERIRIEGNWLSGGTVGVYLNDQGAGPPVDSALVGNVFATDTITWEPWRVAGDVTVTGNIDDAGNELR